MKVTLSKGGSLERTVDINEVEIPDLWYIAAWLKDEAKRRGFPLNHTLSRSSDLILECWHRAHDLKRHIAEGENV